MFFVKIELIKSQICLIHRYVTQPGLDWGLRQYFWQQANKVELYIEELYKSERGLESGTEQGLYTEGAKCV